MEPLDRAASCTLSHWLCFCFQDMAAPEIRRENREKEKWFLSLVRCIRHSPLGARGAGVESTPLPLRFQTGFPDGGPARAKVKRKSPGLGLRCQPHPQLGPLKTLATPFCALAIQP